MFKLSKRTVATAHAEADESAMHAANSSRPGLDIQRELLRVAFKDTMRNTGVPSAWLDCEVHTRPGPAGTEQLEVHLVMKQWSGHLLRYAMAFQKQLLQCMDRYEPTVDHSGFEWMWKFAADCECPFPNMPAPEEWAQKLEARKATMEPAKDTAAARRLSSVATKAVPAEKKDKQFDLRDVFSDLKA